MFAFATTSTCEASAKLGGVATGLGVGLALCEGCGEGLAACEPDGTGVGEPFAGGVGVPFAEGVDEPPPLQATSPSAHAKNAAGIQRHRIQSKLSRVRATALSARITSAG
jgi:hypothetical protein